MLCSWRGGQLQQVEGRLPWGAAAALPWQLLGGDTVGRELLVPKLVAAPPAAEVGGGGSRAPGPSLWWPGTLAPALTLVLTLLERGS